MQVKPGKKGAAVADVPEYFSNVSAEYTRKQYISGARTFIAVRHAAVLEEIAKLKLAAAARVLDAGCGPGFLSRDLFDLGYEVLSMDLSDGMIREARNNIGAERANLAQASIEALPYADSTFDLVCCCGVIEYLPDYEKAAREFLRVLKPAGFLILPTTNVFAPANYLYPIVEYLKSFSLVRRIYDAPPPRNFSMHFHSPSHMARRLRSVGFRLVSERFFFLLPIPRPFNLLLRSFSSHLEESLARYCRTPILRYLGEGYLPVCQK